MNHVNKLMVEAGYSLSGFQDTMVAQVLEKKGTWHIPAKGFRSQNSPPTNIHYNSKNHWVASFQFESGEIYLLDSALGKNMTMCLKTSLKIQLAQIYGKGKSKLTVKVSHIQQQKNGYDCGLFAIANIMEFATNRYKGLRECKLEFAFIQSKMREHLTQVFQPKVYGTIPKEEIKRTHEN